MKLAIVILNWNGSAMLRQYLPSVLEYSSGMDGIEVVVADNASTDDSLTLLRSVFPTVQLCVLERNYGFAEGYNRALATIESEYYLLLNSDVEVTEGWLTPLLSYMEAHLEVAVCQPKIRSLLHRSHLEFAGAAGGYMDAYGYPFCRGRMMDCVETDAGQYDTVAQIFWATGAALLIRSADYWQEGGLDARFFAHQEEIDLCWRLQLRGRKIVCVPQSVVYHLGGGTLPKTNARKTYLNFRNNLLMLYKNLPDSRLSSVMRIRFVLDYLAAFSFLLRGHGRDFVAVIRARRNFRRTKDQFRQLEATTKHSLSGLYQGSLLYAYYLKRIKTFGRLFADKQ